MQAKKYYRSLTRNMILIMLLVSIAPLLLVSSLVGYHFETSYREKVIAHLIEMVQKHQQNINIFLNEKLSYIRVLANTFTFEQLSKDDFLEHKLLNLQRGYGGIFVDLGLVNERGIQVAYAGNLKLERADYSESDWFKKAIEREIYISDVFLGLRKQPHFIVTVKRLWWESEWILRSTVDFEAFNELVESIHIGETGAAYILNREGEYQTRPRVMPALGKDILLPLLKEAAMEEGPVPGSKNRLKRISAVSLREDVRGQDAAVGEVEFGGKTLLYVIMPLKSGEWYLVYQQEEADAFSSVYRARYLAILICVLGGFSILGMAFILSRKIVGRVVQADQEKEMMNEKVIEAGKLASVGELAAGIAHEINNPIAIMVEEAGWIGDLLEEEDFKGSENVPELKRALDQIRTQGERCKEITHKLLSFARRTDPRIREVRFNDLIEEVLGVSEQRSRFSNVKVSTNLDPSLPLVAASPSEMQQVILNLVNNAIDAIGTGGGTIEVTSRSDGDFVVVDVADNGQGIPPAVLPRIFDPFFTTKPVGKGTGLGLSICYGIVKKLGGDITVNSAVDVGTTFHVYLPTSKKQDSGF
ncbi:MAG: ATP-binding protein [Syntrophobacteraceae bacterium]